MAVRRIQQDPHHCDASDETLKAVEVESDGATQMLAEGSPRADFFHGVRKVNLVLLKVIFFIFGLTKVPFGDCFSFFLGFLSKSK